MFGRKTFPSKILLFGEYTIIRNANALAIPFELFEGTLTFPKKETSQRISNVDSELYAFSKFLKNVDMPFNDVTLDADSFAFDVSQGLKFESSIPQGFGVGSSGALCSAVFQRYAQAPVNLLNDTKKMKKIFTILENHFHGESSGLDPLISFYSKPIMMDCNREISLIDILPPHKGQGEMFLLDTGRPRRTEPLVSLFLEKCKGEQFIKGLDEKLIPATNSCIDYFLEGDYSKLKDHFARLSELQFEYFSEMIPKLFRPVWENGISSKKYSLKLCGAGGGGFILGFTENLADAKKELTEMDIRPIKFSYSS